MHDQPIIVKKKKVHGHGHHGGSWKVAYADFVTAMMAFFMVLWILGMSEQDRSIIASYFNDPISFAKNQPPQKPNVIPMPGNPQTLSQNQRSRDGADPKSKEEKDMRSLGENLEHAIKQDPKVAKLIEHVEMTVTPEGLLIELVEKEHSTFFDSGKATLKPAGQKLVEDIGPFIAETRRMLSISGHTDSVPYGPGDYGNLDLSADRAASVRRALGRSGVSDGQIEGVHGFADRHLKDSEHPTSGVNRRVTILLHYSDSEKGLKALPADQAAAEIKPKIESSNRIKF